MLHQNVLATVRGYRMMPAGARVGVAVSGGADSVALLLLLQELRDELGVTLAVLHFNHQLRGSESDADEKFVANLAKREGLEFVCERGDVKAKAAGANVEETARQLRYVFFSRMVASGRLTHVAVGHTADDQAETVLAHILRGTGPTGLGGIYPVMGHVVRPLLDVRRAALRQYLQAKGQAWREDASNLDTTRMRARIRHNLIPILESQFQPTVVERLGSLADLARSDEEAWHAILEMALGDKVQKTSDGLRIRLTDLALPFGSNLAAPTALQRRIVRRLVLALAGHRRRLGALHVDNVLGLAREGAGGGEIQLPGGVRVRRTLDGCLDFALAGQETVEAAPSYEYVVELGPKAEARIDLPVIGKRLILKVVDCPAPPSDTREGAETLDFERLGVPLVLRNWHPGDSYRPRGHQGAHKVKRLFGERRIEARLRPSWPVLLSAGRIVWARGLPVAADCAVEPGTRRLLKIYEERL